MSKDLKNWWHEFSEEIKKTIEYKVEEIAIEIAIEAYQQLKRLGFTQKQLAKRMGVSEAYISQIFNGKNNMTIETLVKLANALQMDLNISLNTIDLKEQIYKSDTFQNPGKEVYNDIGDCFSNLDYNDHARILRFKSRECSSADIETEHDFNSNLSA